MTTKGYNEYNDGRAHIVLPIQPIPTGIISLVTLAINLRCDVIGHYLAETQSHSYTISQRGMKGHLYLWTDGNTIKVSRTFIRVQDTVVLDRYRDRHLIREYIVEYGRISPNAS